MHVPDSDSEDELPPGWEERVTVDGSVFYANHLTKATQWTHPRTGKKKVVGGELPFGWERCVDKNSGKVIYVDHENKRTTYTDPRLAFAVEEKEHAHDYRQRFDASSTALQVLHGRDLTGKTALITGSNTGIGYETARSLARHGATVILACRNLELAQAARDRILADREPAIPPDRVYVARVDLASLDSVRAMCDEVCDRYAKLDMVILNAAVFGVGFELTRDGFEQQFQVNYLSQWYMMIKLRHLLVAGSRVVVVSSESHRFSTLSPATLTADRLSPSTPTHYWSLATYNNTKLLQILFARHLAAHYQTRGISVFTLHPGNLVSSDLARHWWPYRLLYAIVRPFTKSLQQAAATSVFCATAAELTGVTGVYFNNCYRCEESAVASDEEAAKTLWMVTLEMLKGVVHREELNGVNEM